MSPLILIAHKVRFGSQIKRNVLPALALTAMALAACPAPGVTVVLTPLKDNTLVQQTNPASQQSGGQGDIFIGRTGQDGQNPPTISIRRGLVAFDVAAAVPAGATITSARLTVRDIQGLNGDQTVALHRLSQDWGEGASTSTAAAANGDATWLFTFFNSASPGSSPTWTTPGGSYNAAASATTFINDDNGALQPFSWTSAANPQLLVDVQQWLNAPAANFGWIMIGNEAAGNTAKRFTGGEGAVPPALEVQFTVPEPTGAAVAGIAHAYGRCNSPTSGRADESYQTLSASPVASALYPGKSAIWRR